MTKLHRLAMVLLLAIVLSVFFSPTLAQPIVIPPLDDTVNMESIRAAITKPTNAHLSGKLDALYNGYTQGLPASAEGLRLSGEQVQVMFIMSDTTSADSLINTLPSVNASVTAHYKTWVDAWVPIASLAEVANLPGVEIVRPVEALRSEPVNPASIRNNIMQFDLQREIQVGTYESQGVGVTNADEWQAAGLTGSGVDVAIIGVFEGYSASQSAGELPTTIDTYGVLGFDNANGGAAAEIIYDMAPGVNFTFATPDTSTDYAEYIVDLAALGNDIIVATYDYVGLTVPDDGTGPIADAINTATNTYDSLFVIGDGSSGKVNWVGNFCDCFDDGTNGFPDGAGGRDNVNRIINPANADGSLSAGQEISISLRWSDWPTTDQDYDVLLVRWNGTEWVYEDGLEDEQSGTQPPIEVGRLVTAQSGIYGLVILQYSGTGSHVLELRVYAPDGSGGFVSGLLDVEYTTRPYSIGTIGGTANALTVSVVNVDTYEQYDYNSEGPILGPGGVLDGGNDKPDLTDYSDVDTYVYGAANAYGGPAHTAGAAALVREAFPAYTPNDIKTFLQSRAIDIDDTGYDYRTGYGRLFLGESPIAVTETPTPETPTPETPTPETPTPETPTPITPTPITETGCSGPQDICRIAPAHNFVMATGGDYVSRFSWERVPEAEWYHIFISTPDYTTIFFNRWYRTSEVCDGDVCETPSDVWLVGRGEFSWWMTYYYDGITNYNDLYEVSTFSITMPGPSTITVIGPSGTINGGSGIVLEWDQEPNALWYQAWAGPADYSDTSLINWYDARTICTDGTCTVVIPRTLAGGDYEFWLKSWNPAGEPDWRLMSEFTIVP